jgi:hypothetical protein
MHSDNNTAFVTHNEEPINIGFTSLQGTIQATPVQLAVVFGQPMRLRGSHGVTMMWHIEFSDTKEVGTIYDYNQAQPAGPDDLVRWRIGGRNYHITERIHSAFRQGIGMGLRRAA